MGENDNDKSGLTAAKIAALDISIARANSLFPTSAFVAKLEEDQKRMADMFRGASFSFDSPVQRAAQKMRDDMAMYTRYENQLGSTLSQSIASIERDAMRMREILSISNAHKPLISASDVEAIIGRTAARQVHIENFAAFDRTASQIGSALHASYLLPTETVQSLSSHLSRLIDPVSHLPQIGAAWEKAFASKLDKFDVSWALDDRVSASILGFGRLSRIADGIHSGNPYSEALSEIIYDEVGSPIDFDETENVDTETAALGSGLNAELISFAPNSYNRVILAAGFEILLPPALIPTAVEGAIEGATFDPWHGHLLSQTEQNLRRIVEDRLAAIEGPQWLKRRVSDAVRKRWSERQEEERAAGRAVYSAIQYADFMDLADVICQKNNWRDTFHELFTTAEDFKTSLQRLHPVRKCLAHSRPLSRYDVLTLVSETSRILKCLGISIM